MKLHLGCGGTYLDGYINIDFPTSEKTIMRVRADVYQDVSTLDYPENSIEEIRSHHLFEHFDRVDALKTLLKWRRWLKPGGKLIIETPDFFWCFFLFPFSPFKFKMALGRHIFGTQEDKWANHLDFWYKGKFNKVLSQLGFVNLKFSHPVYRNFLPNIKVVAEKNSESIDESVVLEKLLSWYVLKGEVKDKYMKNWLG